MSNLTINVGTMTVNGITIGSRSMDASRKLRVFQPDEPVPNGSSLLSRAVNFDEQMEQQVLAWLARKNAQAGQLTGVAAPPESSPASSSDTRTVSPGVKQIITLRQAFDDLYKRATHVKTDSSWSGYRTLLRYWERHHDGAGPCVTEITKDVLQAFFLSVTEWHAHRSWERNRDLMFALLKSCCAETNDNEYGRPKDEAVLVRDDLPVWKLPPKRWFRDRPRVAVKGKQQRGGHRRRKIPLLKVSEFGQVLNACDTTTFMSPLFWRTWFSALWYNGHRFQDLLAYCWDEGRLHYNLELRLLDFTETKCGGDSGVPMPDWLYDLLTELRQAQGNPASGEPAFAFPKGYRFPRNQEPDYQLPRGDVTNRARRFDVEYAAIWDRAGVPMRHPHEMRSVSVTYWSQHAPEYRFAATGHKPPGGDTQMRSYIKLDEKFYEAARTFPYPD